MSRSIGSTLSRTKASTQSSSAWWSGSVSKSQLMCSPSSAAQGLAAVENECGAGGEGGGVAREVEGGAGDLLRTAAAAQRVVRRRCLERGHVPCLADVGEERSRDDRVDAHRWSEGLGEAVREHVES